MEDENWSFAFSASSRSYQSTLKYPSDLCIDFEEIEEDDELQTEYPCPYCSEDFDLLGLCCHIDDEHHHEAGYGVCPVCSLRVGTSMVSHITTQHGNIFKINRKTKFDKDDSYSTFSSLRKELQDAQYRSLLSFLSFPPLAYSSESVKSATSTEATLEENGSDETELERYVQPSPLTDKEHLEKSKRCEFVLGLLSSTIFDDGL